MNAVQFDLNRMTDRVLEARTDHVLFDFSRVLGPQYARMVEKFSTLEGNVIPAHNNKTLFLEAIDLWGRKRLGAAQKPASDARRITDPREAVVYAMEPWYEAMDLENPGKYRLNRRESPPVYVGDEADAVALMMGMAACLDITPMRFVIGSLGEESSERVWSRIKADGNWYDSDIMRPGVLGDRPDYPHYKEVEVGL